MIDSSLNIIDLIDKKIKGHSYSNDEINWIVNNIDNIPDFQLSSWITAVFIKGLDKKETAELTRAMAYSGHVLTLKDMMMTMILIILKLRFLIVALSISIVQVESGIK